MSGADLVGVKGMTYRWFGREPALVLAALAIALTLVVGFIATRLLDWQAALIIAVVAALAGGLTATYVRPVGPTVFGALFAIGTALVSGLWLDLTQQLTASWTGLVIGLVALLTRPQQTYMEVPETAAPRQARPA